MTLTPQDKATIDWAKHIAISDSHNVMGVLRQLLSILDRLAAEEYKDSSTCKYGIDCSDDCPCDRWEDKDSAPSSPFPDAICVRCGKRYDTHRHMSHRFDAEPEQEV